MISDSADSSPVAILLKRSDVTIEGANDSARYAGSAVGKYAERDIGTDTARKGLFTATANLEANFAAVDMIKGTITDFVDDSGMRRPWHVVLGESMIDDQCVHRAYERRSGRSGLDTVLGTASSTAEATSSSTEAQRRVRLQACSTRRLVAMKWGLS